MMTRQTKLRVLLIDDHAVVREGLRRLIDDEPDMEVVAEAGDGHQGVRLAQDLAPDVALVDVSMPGLDGAQVTRMIAATCPRVRVIALSRHEEDSLIRRLLDAGARGYALKRTASTELTRGIRTVGAGERYLDPAIRSASDSVVAHPATKPVQLTLDEERVLGMIALGHSHREAAGLLSMELAQVLTLRESAVSKAGLNTRAAIFRYALERGWLGRRTRDRGNE